QGDDPRTLRSGAREQERADRGYHRRAVRILAHGIGVVRDLPIPAIYFFVGATLVLAVSFVLLLALWRRPLLVERAGGRALRDEDLAPQLRADLRLRRVLARDPAPVGPVRQRLVGSQPLADRRRRGRLDPRARGARGAAGARVDGEVGAVSRRRRTLCLRR